MAERVEEGTVTESQIYSYPGATRSVLWKYFGFTKKKEGPPSKQYLDMAVVICKLCQKSYANNGKQKKDSFAPRLAHVGILYIFCCFARSVKLCSSIFKLRPLFISFYDH